MKAFGDLLFEIFTVTVLMALGAVSIVGFIPMLVGIEGYFSRSRKVRRFKDIFTDIGKNIKILLLFDLFELIIILFPALNLYFFNTHPQETNYFVLTVSCIALIIGIIYLTTGPTVILGMDVKFGQLLYNGLVLLFGSPFNSLACLALCGGVVALIIFFPYVLPLTLYVLPLVFSKLIGANLVRMRSKATGESEAELLGEVNEDAKYLEECEANDDRFNNGDNIDEEQN